MTQGVDPSHVLNRRGALQVLGAGAASILLTPVLPERPDEPALAERFTYPLRGTVYVGYSHLDPVRERSGQQTGEHHIGIDLNRGEGDDDLGSPVGLIANGRCAAVFDGTFMCGLGKLAIFEHPLPEGYSVYSRYAHLDSVQVKPGESYCLDARVGTIGRSGCQRSAHLHLDIATEEMWQRTMHRRAWYYPTKAPTFWIERYFLDPREFIDSRLLPHDPIDRRRLWI